MDVGCECCVFSGRGLCNELIICPEESYRLWCVFVCDLETSRMRRPRPTGGLLLQKKEKKEDALISQIYFWNEILYISDSSSVHHQEFYTVNTAMVYVIQVC